MRRDIANLAARLMAEDGIDDFGLAKRKAARQLGAPDSEALPANHEIEDALRAYQALYQEDELRERLAIMRQEALLLMRELSHFNPYLTGPVLTGSAGRYSAADIDIFADSAKDVEIFLLDRGIDFEHVDLTRSGPDTPEMRLRVESDDAAFVLSVYPHIMERTRHRNPHSGQLGQRANIDTLTALLAKPLSNDEAAETPTSE